MSPMRRLAEAVCRVPSVQDINVEGTMENLPDTPINDQWDDSIEVTPELNQPMENNIPSTVEQPSNERENTIRDPEVVVERVPLLNGGPPTSQQDVVTHNYYRDYDFYYSSYRTYLHGGCIHIFYPTS